MWRLVAAASCLSCLLPRIKFQQDIQGIDHKPKSHCRHAIVVRWLVQRRNHCLQIHQILHISTGTLGEKFARVSPVVTTITALIGSAQSLFSDPQPGKPGYGPGMEAIPASAVIDYPI